MYPRTPGFFARYIFLEFLAELLPGFLPDIFLGFLLWLLPTLLPGFSPVMTPDLFLFSQTSFWILQEFVKYFSQSTSQGSPGVPRRISFRICPEALSKFFHLDSSFHDFFRSSSLEFPRKISSFGEPPERFRGLQGIAAWWSPSAQEKFWGGSREDSKNLYWSIQGKFSEIWIGFRWFLIGSFRRVWGYF